MSITQQRLTVGIVVPEFPSQTHGFFWRESEHLRTLGLQIAFVSTRPPPVVAEARHEWARSAREETCYLSPLKLAGVWESGGEAIRAIRYWPALAQFLSRLDARSMGLRARYLGLSVIALRLRSMCRRRGIAHLHVHSCADSALLVAMCRALGGPSYSLVMHSPLSCFRGNQKSKWKGADCGVVVSPTVEAELVAECADALPSELLVSSMGFNESVFVRSESYRPWCPGEVLRVAACSRISRGKGIDTLIHMMAMLCRSGITAELQIAGGGDSGDGSVVEELQALAVQLGVASRVLFRGSCSSVDVRDMLGQSHIFVTASRMEAMPVATMEAMAMGLPIVATRVGGVPYLIEDGRSGVLVPVDAPQEMAAAIAAIITTPGRAEQLGLRAAERVSREFTSFRSAQRLAEMLVRRHPGLMDSYIHGERVDREGRAARDGAPDL